MEMVDMKLPKKTKEEMKKECISMPCGSMDMQDRWPYGLQLRFENEQFEQLPSLAEYKVGDMIVIQAEAKVTDTRVSERMRDGKPIEDKTLEMQIEKVACTPKVMKKPEEMNPKEYKKYRQNV